MSGMDSRTASALSVVAALVVGAGLAAAGSAGGVEGPAGVPLFAVCALVALAINWIAFVPAALMRTERFYDATGTLTYLAVVATAWFGGERSALAGVLAVMVVAWALRLGVFLVARIRRDGSDGRFDDIKRDPVRFLASWTTQALWVVVTAGCALAAMTTPEDAGLGVLTVVGVAVWVVGLAVEAVADAQKRSFRSHPGNDGRFITTGLWAWSRHPNYFGEIVLWVGVALAALPALSGWRYLTLVSPVFVALLLTRVSGIPLLEARARRRWGDEPAYRAYVERTPVLVPRPPSR